MDGLTACTTYTFRLRAYGDGTTYKAAWGAWASTATTTDGCPLPAAPDNLTAGTATATSVPLSWTR